MSDLVSVILPTYNRAHLLERAISSVEEQEYPSIELIIIDDGSSDDTERLASKLISKKNLQIIYLKQTNQGASSARNLGVKHARGKWIAFLDSDDEWLPSKLKEQLAFMSAHPDVALCYTDAILIHPDGRKANKPNRRVHHKNEVITFKEVLEDPYFGLPTVIMKKSVFNNCKGFDICLSTAEDLDLYLKVASEYKIGYLHSVLTNIYVSKESLGQSKESYFNNLNVFTRLEKRFPSKIKQYRKTYSQMLKTFYFEFIREELWNKRTKEARSIFHKNLRLLFSIEGLTLYLKSYIVGLKRK